MSSTWWKRAAVAVLVAAAAACGTSKPEGPVFATTGPVAAAKPNEFGFKHGIRVRELEGLTETVQRNLAVVLGAEDFAASLRRSLAHDEMLAPEPPRAVYELTPVFVDLRTVPVNDETTAAQAIFRYRVVRREDGTTIFDKRIKADFTSVADPAFANDGMFSRTLRLVGFKNADPGPVVTNRPGSDHNRAPGPERDAAREVHAARNAIALNLRTAMRYLVAEAPEKLPAPVPVKATPDAEEAEERSEAEAEEKAKPEAPASDGKPLPPLAPEVDSN